MSYAVPEEKQAGIWAVVECRWPVQGQVLCLAAAMDYLFSGGQDTTIRVWKFNAATSTFDPAVKLWPMLSPDFFSCSLHDTASWRMSPGPVLVSVQWSQLLQLSKIELYVLLSDVAA